MTENRIAIAIGSDHAGFRLKESLRDSLGEMGYAVKDVGTYSEESCDYPDLALAVAETVAQGEADKGVLVCGTGAGMAMAANKVPGIRAVACNEPYTAEYCRLHNDANVLALAGRSVDEATAFAIADAFLATAFEGGRHQRRVDQITGMESQP